MFGNHKIAMGKLSAAVVVIPVLLYAFSQGPEPRHTGAPGDTTCAASGCHTGTAVNGGPGNVAITFPSGETYVPGQRQRWTITVTDAQQRVFGFQATARLASNASAGQAGSFFNTDATTFVQCDDGQVRPAAGCRTGFTVEFIQQARAAAANTWTVEWVPPATNVGDVRIFVAGNAANGNGTNTGDRIYTASYTLRPATTGPTLPTITRVADAFNFTDSVAAGTWTAIGGTNLYAGEVRNWDQGYIRDGRLPTSMEGVSVRVNNRPATIHFISANQINVLTPNDIGTGDVAVTVTNAAGTSAAFNVRAAAFKPAFFAPTTENNRLFILGAALDGTLVGKPGQPRANRGVRPGETILLFGTGFGPTSPVFPTDAVLPPGTAPAVSTTVRIRFGETVANLIGSGNLVSAGLYQFAVTVPDTLPDGDIAVVAEVGGVASASNVFLTVQR